MLSDKSYHRNLVKKRLSNLTNEEHKAYSRDVCRKICQHEIWKKAKSIGITISIGKEIDTSYMIEQGWNENKIISVPKTLPKTKEMNYYQIKEYSELEESHFGLREPVIDKTYLVQAVNIDLLIIPCVAFDKLGYRIGYGGGYFDRYLKNFKGISCGIALECQQIERVPINQFDIPLNMVITEKMNYQII